MYSCFSKGKMGKKYPYYYCSKSKCDSKRKSVAKHKIELQFERMVGEMTPTEEYADIFQREILDLWETEYKEYERNYQNSKQNVERLEEEKRSTIAMRRRKEITSEEFEKEIIRLRNEILVAQVETTDYEIDKNQLELLLEQAKLFLTNLEPLYCSFSTSNKQRFIAFAFPKGVKYENEKFRTPEKANVFTLLEEIKRQKSNKNRLVTLPGIPACRQAGNL